MAEMPQLASAAYASSAFHLEEMQQMTERLVGTPAAALPRHANFIAMKNVARDANQEGIAKMANVTRRLVQVFIADPDENVPLADCLLYKGEPQLTDLTDQELFFEVDIKSALDKHNAKRIALINKTVKERTEKLEPARIRDLKMTVVTIAQF